MASQELDLLREAYRQLRNCGFHQRTPEERERLEALFKRLAGFLKDGDREPEKPGAREGGELGSRGAGELGKEERKEGGTRGTLYLNVDGASKGNPGRAGAGGLVTAGNGRVLDSFALPLGVRTNNEAEYLALVEGLKRAQKLEPKELVVRSDSLLLVKQMRGEFKVKKNALLKLNLEARRHFPRCPVVFQHVPREENAQADALANEGAFKE